MVNRTSSADDAVDPAQSVLLLVDYQSKLMPAIRHGDAVVAVAQALADAAHVLGIRVVATEQNPEGLGHNLESVRTRCDATLAKTRFDGCEDGLIELLDQGGARSQVVIAGCEAHVCLMQTALGLVRRGRRVFVVEAACGSRRESDHRLAMRRLERAGATLVSAEMVLFEWLRGSDHPAFKTLLAAIKTLAPEPG